MPPSYLCETRPPEREAKAIRLHEWLITGFLTVVVYVFDILLDLFRCGLVLKYDNILWYESAAD